jgi:hypothetical protein
MQGGWFEKLQITFFDFSSNAAFAQEGRRRIFTSTNGRELYKAWTLELSNTPPYQYLFGLRRDYRQTHMSSHRR